MSLKNLSVTTKIPKFLEGKLKKKRIYQIYKRFEKCLNLDEKFAVAVSGGPDSLSLAFLAKIYSLKKKLKVRFLIVDHKLRSQSTREAKLVKSLLKKISINASILTWNGKKPSKNVQSIARKKRYELLFQDCNKYKINNILLGHHQDDLLENFFIRIFRGSGLKGLISLDKSIKIENKILLRPLLEHKKDDLIFLSKDIFNFYVKDPTNDDEKYQRIKIRNLIKKFDNEGLDKVKFLKTINNLKLSNNVVEFYVKKNLRQNASFLYKKNKLILNKKFFQQPYEIIFRTFSECIKLIGKKYYSVRGKKLDKMIKSIEMNNEIKTTLGGCIIEKVNQTVIISKEYKKT
tara:strand:+ start:593 stop:1630 length:1038 start_codon:yes stop_codon:yes gene_type:complete